MAFDPNDYRKRVLTALNRDFRIADPESGDAFLVCGVDLDADTATALACIDEITAFWQKAKSNPKFRNVATLLVAQREAYEAVLGDPVKRAAAAARIRSQRTGADLTVASVLDRLVHGLVRQQGALFSGKVADLAAIADEEGMSKDGFQRWLARQSQTADLAEAEAWDDSTRRQIRTLLDELAMADEHHSRRYRTLFTFLGVGAGSPLERLRKAHADLVAENKTQVRNATAAGNQTLLAQIDTRLLRPADGRLRYLASLRADAEDLLTPDLRRIGRLGGMLQAAEIEALAAFVLTKDWGIRPGEAREVVCGAARKEGLAVEVNTAVRLVVCAECGRPQTADSGESCAYCRKDLFAGCPACGAWAPKAADVCPECNAQAGALRIAKTTVSTLREALDAGLLAEARRLVREVSEVVDSPLAPAALPGLVAEVELRLQEAPRQWARLLADTRTGALWSAAEAARWLAAHASDIASPDPASPDDAASRVVALERRKAEAVEAVRAAVAGPADAKEPALLQLVRRYPDCPEVRTALARVPLAPPTDTASALIGEDIELSWRPAPDAAWSSTVRYRVDRQVFWPARLAGTTSIGTTSGTSMKDTTAPGGAVLRHSVTAIDGARTSPSADVGPERFVHRELALLNTTVIRRRAVQLEWPTDALGTAEVMIERQIGRPGESKGATRRIPPTMPGRYFDDDVEVGSTYHYRVYLTFRDRQGEIFRTRGRTAEVELHPEPEPVPELRATTDDQGTTTVSYDPPSAGTVRVYAGPGHPHQSWTGAMLTLAELDSRTFGMRLVGTGPDPVVDTKSQGLVAYYAATVSGPDAVLGARLAYVATAKPADLRVVEDVGGRLRISFSWPSGVTEAQVRWAADGVPSPAAAGAPDRTHGYVTAAQLAGTGGYDIDVPRDGRAVHVSVFPALRMPGAGSPVISPVGARLLARAAVPLVVTYSVDIKRFLGPRVDIDVGTKDERLLPTLTVLLNRTEPAHADDGVEIYRYAGGTSVAVLQINRNELFDGYLRLFALPEPGVAVEVRDPPATRRRIVMG